MRPVLLFLTALALPTFSHAAEAAPSSSNPMAGMNHAAGGMLAASSPKNGETGAAPTELKLTFMHAMRLESLQVLDSLGARIPIASLPGAVAQEVSVPMPKLAPDTYEVRWRASADTHNDSGVFHFGVR